MMSVAQANYIKELREKEGASISEIARRLNISWQTAKKYADGNIEVYPAPRRSQSRPVMDSYEEFIMAWLEEDERKRRNQRRTAQKIYKQLRGIGYAGSERTVRVYVAKMRKKLEEKMRKRHEQFIRLEHPCGEAQVDFGEFYALDSYSNKEIRRYHLVMSFPHSNSRYCCVFPAQNSECLFTGLTMMFEEIGGVPPYILFDNLRPVVKKIVSKTKRDLTDAFLDFAQKYRFTYKFCNPGSGWEKGHTEGSVGYIRRNHLTPIPLIDDFMEFNKSLSKGLSEDRKQLHYKKKKPIEELWLEDASTLLDLPETPYEAVSGATAVVNKYGEVKVRGEVYHVPKAHPKQQVFIKLRWDTIEVFDKYCEVQLCKSPRTYVLKADDIDWAGELEIYRYKPRAIEQATYLKALPAIVREYLLPSTLNERRERVRNVLSLLENHTISEVAKAIQKGMDYNTLDLASLVMLAGYSKHSETPKPLTDPWTPFSVVGWNPDLTAYDYLSPGRVHHE